MLKQLELEKNTDGKQRFAENVRPYLANMLEAIGLNVVYERAEGDYLFYQNEEGEEQAVLDMLGGYGVTLFGHNHPHLVETACRVLKQGRPFAAQASSRGYAGLLGGRLSDLLEASSGEAYIATFTNSGTEAVEAAIKHAELEARAQIDVLLNDLEKAHRRIADAANQQELLIEEDVEAAVEALTGLSIIDDIDAVLAALADANHKALLERFCFLAVEGAFHGKTSGSLQLTYNEELRNPWERIGIPVEFVPANDVAALKAVVASQRISYHALVIEDSGQLQLETRTWSAISGCFAEPIQGEGGIHELSDAYLQALRDTADCECYPLIFDEIQSGMGRSGEFLASEKSGVAADYYIFSKALGGGLAKIGALVIVDRRYQPRFGYIHTSTFADDDFSAAIALDALDLLFADDAQLMTDISKKGAYLLERLREIQVRFPTVIAGVRGRGLMIGVELADLDVADKMPLLRVLSQQNLLGFLLCGYFLHESEIRIAPALSSHRTIRLEPSALISYEDLDRFCEALETAAAAIAGNDTHNLVRFLVGRNEPTTAALHKPLAVDSNVLSACEKHVAFLGHFVTSLDLLNWDPSLAPMSPAECHQLLERTQNILKPFVVNSQVVHSDTGTNVQIDILGIPYTAAQMMERVRAGKAEVVLASIRQAVDLARERGCTMMSFGGYTSIVSANCTLLEAHDIGLTSGNSLTAAAAIEAIHVSARGRQIDLRNATLGVVGATGNIGKVLVEIEAGYVGRLVLVGRRGSRRRLSKLADKIYAGIWQQIRDEHVCSGLATRIACSRAFETLDQQGRGHIDGPLLREAIDEQYGCQAPITVTTEMSRLRECDLIISATNAPEPLIHCEHLGPQPVVICDVAVPGDVAMEVQALRNNVDVIKGGVVEYPSGQSISIPGMTLPDGQAYACLTEAVLLGLDSIDSHFSYGHINVEKVKQIGDIARKHGFRIIAKAKLQDTKNGTTIDE